MRVKAVARGLEGNMEKYAGGKYGEVRWREIWRSTLEGNMEKYAGGKYGEVRWRRKRNNSSDMWIGVNQ
jgi:hypothetical protein